MKTEAERLDVMDKAAGILAELLYTDQLLSQIKEYRTIMLPVSRIKINHCAPCQQNKLYSPSLLSNKAFGGGGGL